MTSHTSDFPKRTFFASWSLTVFAAILIIILEIYTTEYDNIRRPLNLVRAIVALFGGSSLISIFFTGITRQENKYKERIRQFLIRSRHVFVFYSIIVSSAILFFLHYLICTSQVKLQLEETVTISVIKNNKEKDIAWLPKSDGSFLRLPVGSYRLLAIIKDKTERDTLYNDSVQINPWLNPTPIIIRRSIPFDPIPKVSQSLPEVSPFERAIVSSPKKKCPQVIQYKYCLGQKFMQNNGIQVYVDDKITDDYEILNSLSDFGCAIVKIKACISANTIRLKSNSCEIRILIEGESSKAPIYKDCL